MSATPRLVVITGATRGLGRAMLGEFAAMGHVVAGCGRNGTRVAEVRRDFPAPHRFATVDVADDRQVAQWAAHVLATVGVPELLVNNAALMNTPAPLWEVPATEFDALVDVNVKGIANVIRHFVPAMVREGRGVIVNFSSGWGRSVSPAVAPYCASKWAVEGLTKALAMDLPEGMAAIALNPGIIDTEMLRTSFGDEAGNHQSPADWAQRAVPQILKMAPKHNGKSLGIA